MAHSNCRPQISDISLHTAKNPVVRSRSRLHQLNKGTDLFFFFLGFSHFAAAADELHFLTSSSPIHTAPESVAPRATEEQVKKPSTLIKRIDLRDFSVGQFANPALQRHYGALQVFALGDDEMPVIKDETLPDEEGL
ncbi:ATP-dependent DNA helicase 2 subunit KU70 [Carex littledalei]|uniref:ATP-dependent DNA helicase 2 subunit KU70 n=1 Tax=Carex littledalei TaxID=544730 RepID=A0A833VAA7_9POAL|nr:ATP-dependent DNA helicase 2 subunit KU70 [Carex littledalei]